MPCVWMVDVFWVRVSVCHVQKRVIWVTLKLKPESSRVFLRFCCCSHCCYYQQQFWRSLAVFEMVIGLSHAQRLHCYSQENHPRNYLPWREPHLPSEAAPLFVEPFPVAFQFVWRLMFSFPGQPDRIQRKLRIFEDLSGAGTPITYLNVSFLVQHLLGPRDFIFDRICQNSKRGCDSIMKRQSLVTNGLFL